MSAFCRTLILCFLGLGPFAGSSAPARAANSFSIPAVTLGEGAVGANLFLHCEHDVTITAFSASLRCDPLKLQVSEVTTTGTNAANPDFFDGRIQNGELTFGVLLGISETSFKTLPPASDDTLLRLTVNVLLPAPGEAALTFVNGLDGGNFPISNVITDQGGTSWLPVLVDGTITVVAQGATFHRGDSDNNGQLQLTDAVRILGYLFLGQTAPTCFDAADADGNNQLQLTDAVRILGYLFLGQSAPASPGPPPSPCGEDNDATHLGCATYDKC